METNVLQLLGGGAFAYIVIKEVFTFVKSTKMGSGGSSNVESVGLLREIKDSNIRNGDKLESINRNMLVMLERQNNLSKGIDELKSIHA